MSAGTVPTLPTKRGFAARMVRRARLSFAQWHLKCLVDERETYEGAGVKLGATYLLNSYTQEQRLRSVIRELEQA